MPTVHRVALLGFSDFERNTLATYLRLATERQIRYEQVTDPAAADFLVADADHADSVKLASATDRLGRTVFIGASAPAGSVARMARPIDPLHVLRELDAMAAMAASAPPPALHAAPLKEPQAQDRGEQAATSLLLQPDDTRVTTPATPALPPRPSALLVDDSAIATRFLETRLERWGLDIARAANSAQALVLLARRDYDFVFLDVELGPESELDGLALCQHIKRQRPDHATLPSAVVMVSAHHDEPDRARGALAGCDAYLGKPLDEVELRRLMMRHGLRAAATPPPAASF